MLYLLFAAEYATRAWIGAYKPIETAGTAWGVINLPFLIGSLVLFVLSVSQPRRKS